MIKMVIRLNIIFVLWSAYFTEWAVSHKRAKRIINGLPLYSHDYYKTHFMVELVQIFACTSSQLDHDVKKDCDGSHKCGGSLIRPDFVLSACHCMIFENYVSETYVTSPVPDLEPGDLPYWIDDRLLTKELKAHDISIGREVLHPFLNTMMIYAGNTSRHTPAQKRHAAAFFPHHLCAARQEQKDKEKWRGYLYEMDIGLIRTCENFKIDHNVMLAPLLPYETMETVTQKFVKESRVCLYMGWGLALAPYTPLYPELKQSTIYPTILQHTFRYLECHSDCYSDLSVCMLCAHHIGRNISHTRKGDSGGPVVCDGLVIGVTAVQWTEYDQDFTVSVEVNIACVKDQLTDTHLEYLRGTQGESYHWLNGHPVYPKT